MSRNKVNDLFFVNQKNITVVQFTGVASLKKGMQDVIWVLFVIFPPNEKMPLEPITTVQKLSKIKTESLFMTELKIKDDPSHRWFFLVGKATYNKIYDYGTFFPPNDRYTCRNH